MKPEEYFKGKNVLVTGGSGFIGSHLCKSLVKLGANITSFDFNGREIGNGIEVIKGDVTKPEQLDKAMKGMDVVFHLAALLGVEKIINIPLEVLNVNLGGTINALDAAIKNKVGKFIFTSSSEIYGEPREIPIHEDDAVAPISVYGVSKIAAEEYVKAYTVKFGLPAVRIRYFNIYGPGQSEKFVMPIFISRVNKGLHPLIPL